MENKENIFLVKIQNCLKLLDEIEDIIGNNPNDQSNIDYELSDYLHIIQENNQKLDDKTKIELVDKIEKARLQREQYNSIYLLENILQKIKINFFIRIVEPLCIKVYQIY